MENEELIKKIDYLRDKKNAIILAHFYQIPEIQDIADFVGDSLDLSRKSAETDADIIVFAGVHFMAETAKILSPQKKVLIPDLDAGCSLASSITGDQVREWKKEFPGAVVVSYVNTTADVKAESDYCVTSSNAVKVVESIPTDKKILFLPDKFLGGYVKAITGKDMEIWDGACHVHEKIGDMQLDKAKEKFPEAEILIHPECGCSTSCMVKSLQFGGNEDIKIYSTEGMITHVAESDSEDFLIATEVGILHRMKKANPAKNFFPASEESVCEYMKMITLEKLYYALKEEQFEVKVPAELAERAKLPIQRMIDIF